VSSKVRIRALLDLTCFTARSSMLSCLWFSACSWWACKCSRRGTICSAMCKFYGASHLDCDKLTWCVQVRNRHRHHYLVHRSGPRVDAVLLLHGLGFRRCRAHLAGRFDFHLRSRRGWRSRPDRYFTGLHCAKRRARAGFEEHHGRSCQDWLQWVSSPLQLSDRVTEVATQVSSIRCSSDLVSRSERSYTSRSPVFR
jgi:hypothetical protein